MAIGWDEEVPSTRGIEDDGISRSLGFWKAIGRVWPSTRGQRRRVHKTANVLDKLPKGVQPKAKAALHDIYEAEGRATAEKALDLFVAPYEAKYPRATDCLVKDREALLMFYDFPAEHWRHIRTTNPIESTSATVRLRTVETKGSGSRVACLTMVFKLMEIASRSWRSLNGSARLQDVISGAEGRSIGSGLVEGACKTAIGRRLKQTGARRRVKRLERMAALCCLHYGDQLDAYWKKAAG